MTTRMSRLDLALDDVVKDASFELDRAGNDAAKLAVWAAKWGDAAIRRLEQTSNQFSEGDGNGRPATHAI